MRRLLLALALCCLPGAASAGAAKTLPISYVEIAAGASFIPTVTTETGTLSYGSDVFVGHGELDYGTALTAEAEIGIAGYELPDLRFAVTYDFIHARLNNGTLVGTLNTSPVSLTVSGSTLASLGLDFDQDVHVLTASAYYNLPMIGPVRPYVGAGLGAAFLQHADTQFAVTATVGGRIALTDDMYAGIKYKFFRVDGPRDDLGITYKPITNHSVLAVLGFYVD